MASIRWIALLFLMVCAVSRAAPPAVRDRELERRVAHVAAQLRCLVCQNQTIADSNAQLALDLKKQVALQLAQGRSEQDVIDFMVQRYGDFVLYRPPFKPTTWLLWFGPFLFLSLGVAALLLALRRQAARAGEDTNGALP
jgi:cytochrome c-type biogenesis protein CcmH